MTDPQHTAFPTDSGYEGVTKREYFAALIASGLAGIGHDTRVFTIQAIVGEAVQIADALIAELNK